MKAIYTLIFALLTLPVQAQILTGVLYVQPTAAASQVATPTFSPAAGTYSSTQTVTISTTTSLAVICYTTDGSTPTETANLCLGGTTSTYSTPISVATTQTVKAIGTKALYTDSAVGSAAYTISASGVTIVQQFAAADLTGSGSATCTFGTAVTAGNTVAVAVVGYLTTTGNITDSGSQSYVLGKECTNSAQSHPFVDFVYKLSSSAITTVSINDGYAWTSMRCYELHGVNASTPLDGSGACGYSDYTAMPANAASGTFTTTQTSDVILGAMGTKDAATTGCVWTLGSGWTLGDKNAMSLLEYISAASSGTYNANGTVASCSGLQPWTAGGIAFRP